MTRKFKTGLCVGKFYPPHAGHHHLIDSAATQCGKLFILLCWKPEESVPMETRQAALRERHPETHVISVLDTLGDDDTAGWADNTLRILGAAPDAVFTSEDYGAPFARLLGSEHVMVDRQRVAFPCSGTQVRGNPYANWRWLESVMRGHYARRVCLVGAESTGKTTLARLLAEHYQTNWVPEYGREYCEVKWKDGYLDSWESGEFTHIAEEQTRRENAAARLANKLLVCDTDAFATSIWHKRYLDRRSIDVERVDSNHRSPDLYLLTGDEIPFVQDGLRDGEKIRHWMHLEFMRELPMRKRPWHLLEGPLDERLAKAIALIDPLLLP